MSLNQYLKNGEDILWTGRPQKNFAVNGWDAFYLFVGILLVSLAIKEGLEDWISLIFLTPFIVFIAFFFILGRLLTRFSLRKRLLYYVTSERVITYDLKKNKIKTQQNIQNLKRIIIKVDKKAAAALNSEKCPSRNGKEAIQVLRRFLKQR